jgi:two-component system, HptB-dependent secretion and biofilm response regulator
VQGFLMPMKWFLDKAFTHDEAEVLKTIAKTANEGIWIVDINGDTLFVNAKMAQMLGYKVSQMQALNIYDILCKTCETELKKPKILEDRHEICLTHKSGDSKIFNISSSTFFGSSGEYLGSLGMFSDITEIKTNAFELKRQKEILRLMVDVGGYLFVEKDIMKALSNIVTAVGKKLGGARCFIYGKGLTQSFIETKMLQLVVYEDKALPLSGTNQDFFDFVNYELCFTEVMDFLGENKPYEAALGDKGYVDAFSQYGIEYVFALPLFINKEMWGFFGIVKNNHTARLEQAQKSAMETMSKNISSVIEKFFVTKQLDNIKTELLCLNQNLEAAVSKAIEDKLKIEQEHLAKELELFAIKEKYHLLQQDDAYKKQIKILRDDLSHKRLGGFLFESFYKPLDILSGDIYGLIKISEKASFAYIVDAMGKGLSASVTAVISASFINSAVDEAKESGEFDFKKVIERYQSFIKKQINEDEMVCAVFVCMDDSSGKLEIANFSMPEVLILFESGELLTKRANNKPITSYFDGVNIESVEMLGVTNLLISSDGLKDSFLDGGGVYRERMYEDFTSSPTKNIFLKKVFHSIQNPQDDVAFIFVSRYEPTVVKKAEFSILPSIAHTVHCMDTEMKSALAGYFDNKTLMQVEYALNELLMNALEHGTLNITYLQKHALLESHDYEEFLENALSALTDLENKKIVVRVEEILIKKNKAVIINVKDSGRGFDVATTLKALSLDKNIRLNGRGILMSDSVLDALFYNESGNEVSIIKFCHYQ